MAEMKEPEWETLTVDGIVARRDRVPYVRLLLDHRPIVQLSIAEARKVALDILTQASRAEADAMIHRFFSEQGYPPGANDAVMVAFREFRLKLDTEPVRGTHTDAEGRCGHCGEFVRLDEAGNHKCKAKA